MSSSRITSLKVKAKLLQKAKHKAGKPIQLKTALGLIAKTSGYASWRDLKTALETRAQFRFRGSGAFWNTWYATYEEASQHLAQHGGYLLPDEKHFFICDIHYIEALGIQSTDPDLKKVGTDWTKPKDEGAWERILGKVKSGQR